MARPKALSKALKAGICARIADGETVRQIALDEQMPAASTIYLALANDAEFSEQYARAREAQLVRLEDELLEIADNATNDWMERHEDENAGWRANGDHIQRSRVRIDTRKWLMAKRAPKKYGDKIEHEHGGKDGGPILIATGVRRAND